MRVTPGATGVRLPVMVWDPPSTLAEIDLDDVTAAAVEVWEGGSRISETALSLVLVADDTWAEGNIEHDAAVEGLHWVSIPDAAAAAAHAGRSVLVVIYSSSQEIDPIEVPIDYSAAELQTHGDANWQGVADAATNATVNAARDSVIARGDAAWVTGPTAASIAAQLERADGPLDVLADQLGDLVEEHGGTWRFTVGSHAGINAAIATPIALADTTPDGASIKQYRGTTWSIPISNLPDATGWKRIYFSVKADPESDLDDDAIVRVALSNPADEEVDGLQRINGAAPTAGQTGSIAVNAVNPLDVTIELAAKASAACPVTVAKYDVKIIYEDDSELAIDPAVFRIKADVTRAVA